MIVFVVMLLCWHAVAFLDVLCCFSLSCSNYDSVYLIMNQDLISPVVVIVYAGPQFKQND